MEVLLMWNIEFDVLNYITLKIIETKEIFLTIKNNKNINEDELKKKFVTSSEVPGFFMDAIKILKQFNMIGGSEESFCQNLSYPELSFELNFIHHFSKLEGKYRIGLDTLNELIAQDIYIMKKEDFRPWCNRIFEDRYHLTEKSANFWLLLMNNLGFIIRMELIDTNFFYNLPNLVHFDDLLQYYLRDKSGQKEFSIRDYSNFISSNFFEAFNKEQNIYIGLQDWLLYQEFKNHLDLFLLSDADSVIIRDSKKSHFKIKV